MEDEERNQFLKGEIYENPEIKPAIHSLVKRCFSEAIGTGALTLLACGVAVGGLSDAAVCIAFGAVIVLMAYSIGGISGCHVNPAVSLNFLITQKISTQEFLVYILGQLIGGFVGSLLLGTLNHVTYFNLCSTVIQVKLKKYDDNWAYICGLLMEAIITFFFIFVINGVTDEKYGNQHLAGMIVGAALTLGVGTGFGFTGGSLNPFRSLGPALAEMIGHSYEAIKQIWIYILGPCIGSIIAATTYRVLIEDK